MSKNTSRTAPATAPKPAAPKPAAPAAPANVVAPDGAKVLPSAANNWGVPVQVLSGKPDLAELDRYRAYLQKVEEAKDSAIADRLKAHVETIMADCGFDDAPSVAKAILRAYKAPGTGKVGRRLDPDKEARLHALLREKGTTLSAAKIALEVGVALPTVQRHRQELGIVGPTGN